jgi:hypothetical protein
MKDELFALESDRLRGEVSEVDYLECKTALEVLLLPKLHRAAPSRQSSETTPPS